MVNLKNPWRHVSSNKQSLPPLRKKTKKTLYLLILQVEDKELIGFSYKPVTSNEYQKENN